MYAFDLMRCAFGQLRKPNPNHNLTITLKLTQYPNHDLCPNPSPNLNPNPIASALRNWPNIAQFVKRCANVISGAAGSDVQNSIFKIVFYFENTK